MAENLVVPITFDFDISAGLADALEQLAADAITAANAVRERGAA